MIIAHKSLAFVFIRENAAVVQVPVQALYKNL